MKTNYYMHQRFLLDCDYESISLTETDNNTEYLQDFSESINLFDTEQKVMRKVKFSYLLTEIDTKADLDDFKQITHFVDNLIIEKDVLQSDNPIIVDYQNSCFKAFQKLLVE